MKYAVASGRRVEAQPNGRAKCPVCGGEVIAKCGEHRDHHWAHQGIRDCDSWAEKETEWHRAWKNRFAAELQEVIQHDPQSGERHIADVRTSHGLVIEFQHSHLDPKERAARERFYGNMLWVVDGTRLQRDIPRFMRGIEGRRSVGIPGYFLLAFVEECFPSMWLDSSKPVIFDFRGTDKSSPPDQFRDALWCLLPGRAEGSAVVVGMSREQFVEIAPSRPRLMAFEDSMSAIAQSIREARAAEAAAVRGFPMPGGRWQRRRGRRF